MNIKRKGEFLISDYNGISVGIESDNIDRCVEHALKIKADGVFGSPGFDFLENDLVFLKRLPDIKKVWFWDINLKDIEGIYSLTNLKYFGIHRKRPNIDFSRLPTLEKVIWAYNAQDTGIETLNKLNVFHISHYNPKEKSFEGIQIPESITELEINWANPPSLEGLPKLPNLKRLGIHRCPNLTTLLALPVIAPNLKHLVVTSSGKVSDGPKVVKLLPKLRHASIQHKRLVSRDNK